MRGIKCAQNEPNSSKTQEKLKLYADCDRLFISSTESVRVGKEKTAA